MKKLKPLFLLVVGFFAVSTALSQANAFINILTQNSGLVTVGGIVNIEVTVGNTGPVSPIPTNKVRAQISVPSALVSVLPNALQTGLPSGWTITVNTGSAITVCNGSDVIPVGQSRTILIRIQGNNIGGPSTITGNLLFSGATCTTPGSLPGDGTADNSSTTSVQVVVITPLTLTDFKTKIVNCEPVLTWVTENEINTSSFEVERKISSNSNWATVGTVPAKINTSTKTEYSFTDKSLSFSTEKVLYRLKMIDKDGNYKYSIVLSVLPNCKTVQIDVVPNPVTNGILQINLAGAVSNSDATLLSLTGKLIKQNRINNGRNYINVSNIATGMYILKVKEVNGIEEKIKVFIENK